MRDDRVDFEDSIATAGVVDLLAWTAEALEQYDYWIKAPMPEHEWWIEKRRASDEYRKRRLVHCLRALANVIDGDHE